MAIGSAGKVSAAEDRIDTTEGVNPGANITSEDIDSAERSHAAAASTTLRELTRTGRARDAQQPPVTLDFQHSKAAQIFHIVDQMSAWSEHCHPQFREYFTKDAPLTEAEEAMLERHAAYRRRKFPDVTGLSQTNGWGSLFEGLFYTAASFEEVIPVNVSFGNWSSEDGQDELATLQHFAEHLDPWLDRENGRLLEVEKRFQHTLVEQRVAIEDLMRFFGLASMRPVPTLLIPNPSEHRIGGGYNSGLLTLEVPLHRDVTPVLIHELAHVFMEPLKDDLAAAAASEEYLDPETLEEGIAHAIAPGWLHDEHEADKLDKQVEKLLLSGMTFEDYYLRVNLFGLRLRPHISKALQDKTGIHDFLMVARTVWRDLFREYHPQETAR